MSIHLVHAATDGTLTTTSEIIAAGTKSEHRNVIRLVRKYLTDFEAFGRVDFKNQTFDTAGGTQSREIAVLNREQAMFAMTMFRNNEIVVAFKKNLIRAFTEMEKRLAAPMSEEEIVHRALQVTYRKVQELEAKVQEYAPKVAYHDEFVADEDLIQFRTLANQLEVGEQHLRKVLQSRGWIYRQDHQRWSNKKNGLVTEYQWRAVADKKKYFRLIPAHDAPRLGGEVRQTLKITPAGAEAIARALRRWQSQELAA